MDVNSFVDKLLVALANTELFERISFQAEGPTVSGYAYLSESDEIFLRVYFNETTDTIAFALIEHKQRIWGIDRDNRRGWHLHPVDNPTQHISISPLSVPNIIARLQEVLVMRE